MVSSTDNAAVYATTVANPSPTSDAFRRTAVVARGEGLDTAVQASTGVGYGVYAENDSAAIPTVVGSNQGVGPAMAAVSRGHGAQLVLAVEDGATTGPPPGFAETGYIRLDAAGDIWICTEGAIDFNDPGPFSWARLLREDNAAGRVVPITPIRILDTRATGGRASGAPSVPGQKKGPLKGGETLSLDLAGHGGIPSTASGVMGNATVIKPTATGFLRVLPAGSTVPASSFNFTSGQTIANGFTSALAAAGLSAIAPMSASATYHLVIDIAAYIT